MIKRNEGIGEDKIKTLAEEARSRDMAVRAITELAADDWIDLDYAAVRIDELNARFKKTLQSMGIEQV
jgi:hypothetical protein